MAKIKLRRDTAAQWALLNPVLAQGEPGLELDTNKVKYGDGTRAWNDLPHATVGADLGNFKIVNNIIGTTDSPDTGGWGGYDLNLDPGGESWAGIQIPGLINQNGGGALSIYNQKVPGSMINLNTTGGVQITSTGGQLVFDVNGNLTLPATSSINQNYSVTKTSQGYQSGAGVIWTASNSAIVSAKLTIQIEANETGDNTGWHTQICEAVVAKRWTTQEPVMTVYAVTHTSVDVLATFTIQRNPTTQLMEVVVTPTAANTNGAVDFRIHSVELFSRD